MPGRGYGQAGRIAGISLTSADADALAEFYVAVGFARAGVEVRGGPAFANLLRLPHAEARAVLLTLGQERLELVTFAGTGRPYPRKRASNDPWFQHFAIVVSSMDDAYRHLCACAGWTPITQPGPQRLPASSGGVAAFKFRDPEGHPLELLEFPQERKPPAWRAREAPTPFLGIDHSAVVVASSSRSIDFYAGQLGFTCTGGSRNRGIEQALLDGLEQPEVEVTALAAAPMPPHLELLCYRTPAACAPAGLPAPDDVAATRLLVETAGSGSDGSGAALIHDPDGHALVLTPAA
ncbi:MAG: VOC family protein [Steroidobacteraceae bacterium]